MVAAKASSADIVSVYEETKSIWKTAERLGVSGQSVHKRLKRLGVKTFKKEFTREEDAVLMAKYDDAAENGLCSELALSMGRSLASINVRASRMKLGKRGRSRRCVAKKLSESAKSWHAVNDHPRGMLGKVHTDDVKMQLSRSSRKMWKQMSRRTKDEIILKRMRSRASNGSMIQERRNTSWKAGWREIGELRKYYRSSWEANFARYLQWLKINKQILNWEHEPETFWFEGIKRGCMSYLPDFRVKETDCSYTYYEVKGWMIEARRRSDE